MNATVAMTGQGGWPMTCFLTPDGSPFYCGTYYPPTPRGGMPSFTQLLEAIADTFTNRRDEVDNAAQSIVTELQRASGGIPYGGAPIDAELLNAAGRSILGDEDVPRGGFGGAPKFPPSALLEGLLRQYERTGSGEILGGIERTAEAMARGGIYDQLGGGFSRYSVDAEWVVPHFEKMLYDNALLLRFYAHWARRTGSDLATRVTEETARFLLSDLLTENGCFASALDADTDGVEGLTYVWTPTQLVEYSARRTGSGRRSCSGSPIPEPSKRVRRYCSCSVTPTTGRAGRRSPTLYARPGSASTARPRRQGGDGLERADRHGFDGSGTCPGPTRLDHRGGRVRWRSSRPSPGGRSLASRFPRRGCRRPDGRARGLRNVGHRPPGSIPGNGIGAVARCGAAVARRHCRPLR